jgi:hypothetical protein
MEGAETHPSLTDALDRDVLARECDQIGRLTDPRHVLVEDSHLPSPYGSRPLTVPALPL